MSSRSHIIYSDCGKHMIASKPESEASNLDVEHDDAEEYIHQLEQKVSDLQDALRIGLDLMPCSARLDFWPKRCGMCCRCRWIDRNEQIGG